MVKGPSRVFPDPQHRSYSKYDTKERQRYIHTDQEAHVLVISRISKTADVNGHSCNQLES